MKPRALHLALSPLPDQAMGQQIGWAEDKQDNGSGGKTGMRSSAISDPSPACLGVCTEEVVKPTPNTQTSCANERVFFLYAAEQKHNAFTPFTLG